MIRTLVSFLRGNALALLALFVALGGTAFAASVAKNSVTSKSVKDRSLKGVDLAGDTLTGAQIKESSLQGVQGPRGEQGPQGTPGPVGPPGPGAEELRYESGPVAGSTTLATIGPLTIKADCTTSSNDLVTGLTGETTQDGTLLLRSELWRDNTDAVELSDLVPSQPVSGAFILTTVDAESAAAPPREARTVDALFEAGGAGVYIRAWVDVSDVSGTGPATTGRCAVAGYAFRVS
jgi:hypothetical protein